ncbi:MAG: M1 family metallopeptidase, partial [Bacteroidota bacterium]
YVNNSPDTLRELWLHCWPRAYQDNTTAYARQELRNGDTDFHFSEVSERGTLDSLSFRVDGSPVDHTFDANNTDIALIRLNQGLLPGASILIETPFWVKIPASFSRLGRVGNSYQITQWYPKPAVYDQEGWHPMPYLDAGEYCAEFGSFKVAITLPENYVVGATGVLQESEEREWLLEKATQDRKVLSQRGDLADDYVVEAAPASATTNKTITYLAEDVHDFAWFADKRFKVLHDTLRLARTRFTEEEPRKSELGQKDKDQEVVDIWAFFTETEARYWTAATDYLKRATRFYSEHLGPYPYPQVSAVQSALSAGGGMEYPMITVIGLSQYAAELDEVLAHEVGHNWFQGILASNEREHPWLDEGLNSYYEQRYMATFYPNRPQSKILGRAINLDRLGYEYSSRLGVDQPPATPSDSLSFWNYWISAYSKPALSLHQLAARAGEDKVDAAFRAYYENWQFRHPGPEAFYAALEQYVNAAEVADFRAAIETTEPQEYLPEPAEDRFYQLKLISGQREADFKKLFYLPLLGSNRHDGLMAGLALHNRSLSPRKIEWIAAPLYGFKSKQLTGMAGARLRVPMASKSIRQLVLSSGVNGFSNFTLDTTQQAYAYRRIGARAELFFNHPAITLRRSSLFFQAVDISQNRPVFSGSPVPVGEQRQNELFFRLGYRWERRTEINPLQYALTLEYKDIGNEQSAFLANHLRLDARINGAYQYDQDKFLHWRIFGGYFLSNDLRESSRFGPSSLALVDNANSDYRYEELYFGRNAPTGNWGEQQLGLQQGGFRAPISRAFNFGQSNTYLMALNLDADLPFNTEGIPLGVFLDAGYYGTKATSSEPISGEFSWVAGPSLSFMGGKVGVFLPVVADPDTKALLLQRGNLLRRISFRLNLSEFLPWRWIDSKY